MDVWNRLIKAWDGCNFQIYLKRIRSALQTVIKIDNPGIIVARRLSI